MKYNLGLTCNYLSALESWEINNSMVLHKLDDDYTRPQRESRFFTRI
jgi:hypothetical protein